MPPQEFWRNRDSKQSAKRAMNCSHFNRSPPVGQGADWRLRVRSPHLLEGAAKRGEASVMRPRANRISVSEVRRASGLVA